MSSRIFIYVSMITSFIAVLLSLPFRHRFYRFLISRLFILGNSPVYWLRRQQSSTTAVSLIKDCFWRILLKYSCSALDAKSVLAYPVRWHGDFLSCWIIGWEIGRIAIYSSTHLVITNHRAWIRWMETRLNSRLAWLKSVAIEQIYLLCINTHVRRRMKK